MQTKNLMDYNFMEAHVIKARLTCSYAKAKNCIEQYVTFQAKTSLVCT